MILIDYIYFQFTNLYRRFNKDGIEKSYGLMMVCGLLCWNLTIFVIIIDFILNTNIGPSNKYLLLLYYLPVILLVCLRYWKFTSYEDIKEKVKEWSRSTKITAHILLIIYVIISFPGAIYLAAKLHFLNQG